MPIAATIFIYLVIFTWGLQIQAGGSEIPAFLLFVPILLFRCSLPKLLRAGALSIALVTGLAYVVTHSVEIVSPIRSIAMAVVLPFAMLAASEAFRYAQANNWYFFVRWMPFVLAVQVAAQISEIFGYSVQELVGENANHVAHYFLPLSSPTGFFNEPSHLAISYSPLILYFFLLGWRSLSKKSVSLGLLIVSAALCPSATLFATILLVFFVGPATRLWALGALAVAASFLPLSTIAPRLMPAEVKIRVDEVVDLIEDGRIDNKTNASAAVFVAGAIAARSGAERTAAGVGIGNLEVAYDDPRLWYYRYYFDDRNIRDGGSAVFKVVGEFGILGILFLGYCALIMNRACDSLRSDLASLMPVAFMFPLLVCAIRGSSYFDGPILISLGIFLFPSVAKSVVKTRRSPQKRVVRRLRNK